MSDATIREMAMAICQEHCAYMGEPPCWRIRDNQNQPMPWPPPACDEPGCIALAAAAFAALSQHNRAGQE